MTASALKFQVGARTLAAVDRDLARVALSLDDVLAGFVPTLPPAGRDGYAITSLPEALLGGVSTTGLLAFVRQRYVRYHTHLTSGHDAWLAGLSANARSSLKRKTKKLAAASGGTLDIRAYRTPDEFAVFHPLARAVSATTYQERLLDAGMPGDARSVAYLHAAAAADALRAWLLFVDDEPVAYLCCTASGDTLLYNHVGHDPAANDLSPGIVLQAEAMRQLFADRFARFDFTEGEGQHKRLFATAGTPCVDLLLLRPTIANRALLIALGGFERATAFAKRGLTHPRLAGLARRVRR